MFPVTLQGLGKWEIVYSGNLTPPRNEKSLEPVELPLLADNRFLVVGTRSINVKPSWIRAGYLTQVLGNINVNDLVIFPGTGDPVNTADSAVRLIRLNTTQLIIYPDLVSTYRLFFEPVQWIKDLTLVVWQFTGHEVKQLDLLTEINNKLNQ